MGSMGDMPNYVDAPLARFLLERLVPDPTGELRSLTRPFLSIGDFVSMPDMVRADDHAHERYQLDRLFTLVGLGSGSRAELDASGATLELVPDQSLVLSHASEDIRVTLTGFSSRSVLHALAKLH
jgi:hypothetical protein